MEWKRIGHDDFCAHGSNGQAPITDITMVAEVPGGVLVRTLSLVIYHHSVDMSDAFSSSMQFIPGVRLLDDGTLEPAD